MRTLSLKTLLVLFFASSLFFTSCKKDENTTEPKKPTINFLSSGVTGDVTVNVGETFTVNWDVQKGDAKLDNVTVLVNGNDKTGYPMTLSGNDKDRFTTTDTFSFNAAGTNTIIFRAVDADNQATSKTIMVTVKESAGPIESRTAIMFGAQNNGSVGSSYAVGEDMVYKVADAKTNAAKVDFIYYYGATNKSTIASPSDATVEQFSIFDVTNWAKRNMTHFGATTMSSADFDAITNDAEIVAETQNITNTKANMLAVGNVVAFETEDGIKGLFRVEEINGTDAGSIKINIKMQKQ